jgi:hypothetical protein
MRRVPFGIMVEEVVLTTPFLDLLQIRSVNIHTSQNFSYISIVVNVLVVGIVGHFVFSSSSLSPSYNDDQVTCFSNFRE